MKNKRRWLIPFFILVVGLAVSYGLIKSKNKPKRTKAATSKEVVVRVTPALQQDHQIHVHSYATSTPSQELAIAPQVSGRVISIAENFIDGNFVTKGQVLFTLDPIDTLLQTQQSKASLAKAEFDLENVQAQKEAALAGYRSFVKSQKPTGELPGKLSPLAQYTPQIKNAQAALASAKANLQLVELNHQRTVVYAPFSGYLRQAKLAVGQQLSVGQVVSQLFADRPVRFKVSLPLSDLPWVNVSESGTKGSSVILEKKVGPQIHRWFGAVTHQFQEIDPLGRMAQVMVEVNEPLSNFGFSLPLNLQLNVDIEGRLLEHVFVVPLHAIRGKNTLWIVKDQNQLEIREVQVLRKEKDFALIQDGLQPGDLVITSPLEAAIPGMSVKVYSEGSPKSRNNHEGQL